MATFPNSPTLGQTADIGSKTFTWNGYAWSQTGAAVSGGGSGEPGATGAIGATGADGADGATGATGPVGDYVESFNGATGAVEGVSSVNGQTGDVTVSGGGGGTFASSYSGHIYAPSEGTYYLDPRAPAGRTITEFYAICGTGGISADLYNSGASVGSLNVTPTGATASLSNTSLAEGGTLELVTSNYSACYDFRFAVRYTQ